MNTLRSKSYLNEILLALETLFHTDQDIISEHTCELTLSHRLGHYLANILEPQYTDMFVDCEYQRDITQPNGLKHLLGLDGNYQRPDILFHDRATIARNYDRNIFVIEVKWKNNIENDQLKVIEFIRQYNYHEGYCVYDIHKESISILQYTKDNVKTGGQLFHYHYDFEKGKMFL